ncbi:MAG: S8 family serine peptidase, partial [Ignavibacteria bacterium]|nr:S8 family serine peptidase [Ignavibacteria bacterium]
VFGPYPGAYTTDLILAKGLQWSWTRGASVINCSWGGGVPSPLITNAIRDAVKYGRSGRGTVVFGGSGNSNVEEVIYPASMPEVIGVGGLSPCNQRKSTTSCDNIGGTQNWGACYGEGLSVVAPTTFIGTTTLLGGWCICGNGTSAASPLAAGVGALIISKNINLSGDSVKMIIERSARKVGNYSYNILKENGWWNNEMGYGAIDAKAALDMTPAGPSEVYEQIPPVIKIYPPESGIFSSVITLEADIYDLSGIATGVNSPRIYYHTIQRNDLQIITGVKISQDRYRFTFPVIPLSEGFYYYIAAQDVSNVPNVTTYPPGGKGYNPPGKIPPERFMFVRNTRTYDTILTSNNVPIPINSFRDTFSILNVAIDKIVLDVNCLVNIEHTYDADLIFSLISPSGTEITLAGGVGDSGRNFINTEFDDEAQIAIDSSLARAPFTGVFKPIDRLWLFDGESASGVWKLRLVDNGIGDKGNLLAWSLKFRFSDGPDYVTVPGEFSLVKNYPNPFNPVTRIVFNVPRSARIKISVYDITGRLVKIIIDELRYPMLEDFVDFDASGLASGIYFCTMEADGRFIDSRKMVLVR